MSNAGPRHEGPVTMTESERMLGMAALGLGGAWGAGWLGGVLFGFAPRPDLTTWSSLTSVWGVRPGESVPFLVAATLTLVTLLGLGAMAWAARAIMQERRSDVHAPRHQLAFLRALPVAAVAGVVAGASFAGLSGRSGTGMAFGIAWAVIAGCLAAWRLAERTVPNDRFVLGHRGRDGWPGSSWVTTPRNQNVLVVASPRSYKTSNILIPSLLALRGSVLFTSTRSDVLEAVYRERRGKGTVWLWDPMALIDPLPPGVQLLEWTPLSTDWRICWEHAAHFATSAGESVTNSNFWKDSARKLIALTFYAAALGKLPLSQAPELADEPGLKIIGSLISKYGVHQAQMALQGLVSARELKSIQSQAGTGLALLHTGIIRRAGRPEPFDFDGFLGGENTIAVVAKPDAGGASGVGPFIACLAGDIASAIHRVSHAARATEGTDRLPLLHTWVLDELANLAPIPSLSSVVSESAGRGHLILAAIQSKNQLRTNYGDSDAAALWDTFGTKVFGPGITDSETLNDLASMLGAHTALQERLQGKAQARDAQSRLLEHELRELKLGKFLVVSQGQLGELVSGNYFATTRPFADWARGILTPPPGRARRAGEAVLGAWIGLVQDVWTAMYERRHPARTPHDGGSTGPRTVGMEAPEPAPADPPEAPAPDEAIAGVEAHVKHARAAGVKYCAAEMRMRDVGTSKEEGIERDEDGVAETQGAGEEEGSEGAEAEAEEALAEQLALPLTEVRATTEGTDNASAADGLVLAPAPPYPPSDAATLPPPLPLSPPQFTGEPDAGAPSPATPTTEPSSVRGRRPRPGQKLIPNRLPQGCERCEEVVRAGEGVAWRGHGGWLVLHEGCRDAA